MLNLWLLNIYSAIGYLDQSSKRYQKIQSKWSFCVTVPATHPLSCQPFFRGGCHSRLKSYSSIPQLQLYRASCNLSSNWHCLFSTMQYHQLCATTTKRSVPFAFSYGIKKDFLTLIPPWGLLHTVAAQSREL